MISWLLSIPVLLVINVAYSADTLKTNTVLYRVSHPEHENVSYLFGTHHAFGKSFFDSLNTANEALLSCDILIKENLNIPGQMAEDIISKRTKETKWTKYLSKNDLEYIRNIFSSGRMDFNKMTPAELFAFLSRYYKRKVCLANDLTDKFLSLDDYIGTIAAEHQMEILGLETIEEQIEMINKDIEGMPVKVHKKRLSRMIARLRSNTADNCSEIAWYREMDFDFNLDQPCQNALILTDRNNKWMAEISESLREKNCFIAVGLSHLMFECGLISQLGKLGFHIESVGVRGE